MVEEEKFQCNTRIHIRGKDYPLCELVVLDGKTLLPSLSAHFPCKFFQRNLPKWGKG